MKKVTVTVNASMKKILDYFNFNDMKTNTHKNNSSSKEEETVMKTNNNCCSHCQECTCNNIYYPEDSETYDCEPDDYSPIPYAFNPVTEPSLDIIKTWYEEQVQSLEKEGFKIRIFYFNGPNNSSFNNKVTVVSIIDTQENEIICGFSFCSLNDRFEKLRGKAIALYRILNDDEQFVVVKQFTGDPLVDLATCYNNLKHKPLNFFNTRLKVKVEMVQE